MGPQTSFWSVFFNIFFEGILESIFSLFFSIFFEFEPRFLCAQPVFCKDFHQIEFFEKVKNNLDFGSVLGGQSDAKSRKHSVAKSDFFEQ